MGCKPFCPDSAYGIVPARVGRGGGIPFGPPDMGVRGVDEAPAEYLFGLGELELDLGYGLEGPAPSVCCGVGVMG